MKNLAIRILIIIIIIIWYNLCNIVCLNRCWAVHDGMWCEDVMHAITPNTVITIWNRLYRLGPQLPRKKKKPRTVIKNDRPTCVCIIFWWINLFHFCLSNRASCDRLSMLWWENISDTKRIKSKTKQTCDSKSNSN